MAEGKLEVKQAPGFEEGTPVTEAEWLTCADPQRMMDALQGGISLRKLRLFSVACCRQVWHLLLDDRSRHAVEIAEQLADGLASEADADAAGEVAAEVDGHNLPGIPAELSWRAANAAAHLLPLPEEMWQLRLVWQEVATVLEGDQIIREGGSPEMLDAWSEQSVESGRTMGWTTTQPDAIMAELLREVIGPWPSNPVAVDPGWQSATVVALAQAIYKERAFDRLPILADALEDAGCTNAEILSHCRGPGPHGRGCWVVDMILGKE